jgi:integrase
MLKPLQVEKAKAGDKPYKLADKEGLFLHVSTTGAKSWRYAFRFAGRAQLLTIGQFPQIGLGKAREWHFKAQQALANGQRPTPESLGIREAKTPEAGTFKALAEQWFKSLESVRSASWQDNVRRWLDDRVLPEIGKRPVKDVQPADVLAILKSMEREGKARSAESVRQMVSAIYDHAIRNLWTGFNPAQSLLGAVPVPAHVPHPHIPERELPAFLSKLDAYQDKTLRLAVTLLLLTAVRKGELLGATWPEVDLDRKEWRIPATRTKGRREHIVPLSTQALQCLAELKALGGAYVVPSPVHKGKPISRSLLSTAFQDLGGGVSPHGLRSTFSTIANERSGSSGDVIEASLAHVEGNQVRRAYNRASYMDQRAKLLQWWGDYLDNARVGNVVTLPRRA